jgi:hypothetical protein
MAGRLQCAGKAFHGSKKGSYFLDMMFYITRLLMQLGNNIEYAIIDTLIPAVAAVELVAKN